MKYTFNQFVLPVKRNAYKCKLIWEIIQRELKKEHLKIMQLDMEWY